MYSEQSRNRLAILKAIRHGEPLARTQLPGRTGLSAGTVSTVTADLVARGLVCETRDDTSARGRPRVQLTINSGGALVAGASIVGVGKLSVAVVDLSGHLLHEVTVQLGQMPTLPEVAAGIAEAIREALLRCECPPQSLSRIGLALPAVLDTDSGTVLFMTTFPQEPTPFAAIISDALGVPVTIENDVVVRARAEHWFGRAQDLGTFTLVYFGLALGSARYVDGLPWTGSSGITAEIGHTKIDWGPQARPCYCGGRGCASAYASMYGALQAEGRLEGVPFPTIELIERRFAGLVEDAAAGEERALAQIAIAAERLGQAVANHVNAADPGDVLIQLPDARVEPLIRDRFTSALHEGIMPGMHEFVRVTFALADPNWRWKGTAALALEQTYLG